MSGTNWRAFVPAALILLSPAAAYLVGRNQNALFLSILTALALCVVCATPRRWVAYLIALAAAWWTWSPSPMKTPSLYAPAVVNELRFTASRLPDNEQWRYTFSLRDLASHVDECGAMPATIYIDGGQLSADTIEVQVDGVKTEPPRFVKSNGLDQIQLGADVSHASTVSVLLRSRPGTTPAIRVGPETLGAAIYSDAVFVELKNERCTVLYQTRRETLSPRHTS